MQMKHIAVHMNQFVVKAKALFSSAHLHRDFFTFYLGQIKGHSRFGLQQLEFVYLELYY